MDSANLNALRSLAFLEDWAASIEPSDVGDVRRILTRMLDDLIALGPSSLTGQRLGVLRGAVAALNGLNHTFICSLEREDLVDHFFAVGAAAEIPEDSVDEVVEHRAW